MTYNILLTKSDLAAFSPKMYIYTNIQRGSGIFLGSLTFSWEQRDPVQSEECRVKSCEWREVKFGEAVERVSQIGKSGLLPSVEYEDINSGQGTLNKDVYSKSVQKTGTVFRPGDILYGKLRPYLKNWILADFQGIAVGDFWVLRGQNIDAGFLYCLIQTPMFSELANQSTGTKMPRADWNVISNSSLQIPNSRKEQQLIGSYFSTLNSLITLHQREPNFR